MESGEAFCEKLIFLNYEGFVTKGEEDVLLDYLGAPRYFWFRFF